MNRLLLFICFVVFAAGAQGQNNRGARVVTASGTIQDTASGITLQVGVPFLGQMSDQSRATVPADIRFPFGILYLYPTFAEESFTVSKGYFGDKILLNWTVRNNAEITGFKIFKRIYTDAGINPFEFLIGLDATRTEYEDKYVDGGVLYEYKVAATIKGIITESLYDTYITGIGFRNPTAIVTGNISYKGGNPVKDVVISALPQGSTFNRGSSLLIPEGGKLSILPLRDPIQDQLSVQAWLKPDKVFTGDSDTPIRLFSLSSANTQFFDILVNYKEASKILMVKIGTSEFLIHNYFPSGDLNARGNDVLIPLDEFNKRFTHFSVVVVDGQSPLLFINGRPVTKEYSVDAHSKLLGTDANYTSPFFDVTIPADANDLNPGGILTTWDGLDVGGGHAALIDEIRVWRSTLNAATIRTDYSRYLNGNNSNMLAYLSANEGAGKTAYDLSKNGFTFNNNHGELWNSNTPLADRVTWASGSGNFPDSDQLGVLGVSDENGNYEITSIPYSGTGESFNIVPMYGLHQFEPARQLVYLGEGSAVANKIDFKDISSFLFKGRILYDTRGVFKSFVEINSGLSSTPVFTGLTIGDEYVPGPGIVDEGYNYYEHNGEKYYKGEYWYNTNNTPGDDTDDYLERYARIGSSGVNVYIDGNVVLDENNTPVETDAEGYFEISVPIGKHYLTIKKSDHSFLWDGRFPAGSGNQHEFFEDANEPVIFVDTTKVIVVGRVVGGVVEAQKPIGFGHNGLFEKSFTDSQGITSKLVISSKNNIGTASVKLGFKPQAGLVTPYTEFEFRTNSSSGEYRVSVLPLPYEILPGNLKIPSNPSLVILDATESLNLEKSVQLTTPEYEFPDGNKETGTPFHFAKSFTYRSNPEVEVIDQQSDARIKIGDTEYSTVGFAFPIYSQFLEYDITVRSFEKYQNLDGLMVEDFVPVIDGELIVTNNLALENSEEVKFDDHDRSIIHYTFRGGMPSIYPPFTKTIDIKYRIKNVDYEVNKDNFINKGILLGGQSDGSQTFITSAPDVPDIILRDPPGSNSFASFEKGTSISLSTTSDDIFSEGLEVKYKTMLGTSFEVSGPVGPVIKTETKLSKEGSISTSNSSKDAKTLTTTYTFHKTISTSSDPNFVGAEGDLYIGNSKNYYYGSYDDIQVHESKIGDDLVNLMLINSDLDTVYISKQKAMYFRPEPSETFFVYSQKYIIESLIPDIQEIIDNIENGVISEDDEGVLTVNQYKEQINLWRKAIFENEKQKYLIKNNKAAYKDSLATILNDYRADLRVLLSDPSIGLIQSSILLNRYDRATSTLNLLEKNYEENISFDAGVGSISKSTETTTVTTTKTEFTIKLDLGFALEYGFTVNEAGWQLNITGALGHEKFLALSEEETKTTQFTYTLADTDPSNLLSVDVVNIFDGNGPVFSTIGGRTSCPYEGEEKSFYYSHEITAPYDPKVMIQELAEDKRESLSFATQRAEDPKISVEVANLTNIPEGKKAEFVLMLENRADNNSDDARFNYFELIVDNLTNRHNALINILQNGTVVYIPYGQTVYYTLTLGKSVSDVFDYDSVRIVLQSRCDPVYTFDDVYISAHFVPTCSEVNIAAPLGNWVYNRQLAYNVDNSTNPLQIKLNGFNTNFSSFKKIDLEYRLSTSPNWTRLHTYYTNQGFLDDALLNNETEISLISGADLFYAWDIAGDHLPNGNYEIRARSTCTNSTEFISDVVTGKVDLESPQRFGTPSPANGILSLGDDLKVYFNEPVFYNSAVSLLEIKGSTNQMPIKHNVSLGFSGSQYALIKSPSINTGDLSIEFWMKNSTTASSVDILSQNEGIAVRLDAEEIVFEIGGLSARGEIALDGLYHHYTFTHKNSTGEISIYEDDSEIGGNTGSPNLDFSNPNDLIIGGNGFTGNLHDLRLWAKTLTLTEAYSKMYDQLKGHERYLIGYWPMNEGTGTLANDLARFKHAEVNASWDINPRGTAYEFDGTQFLILDNVGFVQLTDEMDATISFWMKTDVMQNATLFSNGRGDGTDPKQANGLGNKWCINLNASGNLSFESEGNSYKLSSTSVTDGQWHHVALLINRNGSLRSFIDAKLVGSSPSGSIGGFSGNKIWIGARGYKDLAGTESTDRVFQGQLDEFRLWNSLRNYEQISRDRFQEVSSESLGLMLYCKMNKPPTDPVTAPRYYHAYNNQTINSSIAQLNSGQANYSLVGPPIKPEQAVVKFQVKHVINGDEMVLEPEISDWALLEEQILDITVHRMFDAANNQQQSPITFTAFVDRNTVKWYVEGHHEFVDLKKNSGEELSFEIIIQNKGGLVEDFSITNLPSWLRLNKSSGYLQPNSITSVEAQIDKELAAGEYLEEIYLQTDSGLEEKLQIKLRVLVKEPDWDVDASNFSYSMSIVGKLIIDGVYSSDEYDRVGVFVSDSIRGSARMVFNEQYQEYFVYLTVFSNSSSGDSIEFRLWDASQGRVLEATIDGAGYYSFLENTVVGTFSNPALFENTNNAIQLMQLNKGWTWISFYVNDPKFSNLNALTRGMLLESEDVIKRFDGLLSSYTNYLPPKTDTWAGTLASAGGLSSNFMYKVRFSHEQSLRLKGPIVNIESWSFPVKKNWNWLPYPLYSSQAVAEALANFNASDGDVVKSQSQFAIYDPENGWNGTLNYFSPGGGYMLKSANEQVFSFPSYLLKTGTDPGELSGTPSSFLNNEILDKFSEFSQNMTVVVQLPEQYSDLYAYTRNGELRGFAINQRLRTQELCFITLFGNETEDLYFHIGDGSRILQTSKSIKFTGDGMFGSVKQPLIISLEDTFEPSLIYPNPFTDEFRIQVRADRVKQVEIKIYSLAHQLVFSEIFNLEAGMNVLEVKAATLADGMYFINIHSEESSKILKGIKK